MASDLKELTTQWTDINQKINTQHDKKKYVCGIGEQSEEILTNPRKTFCFLEQMTSVLVP